VVMAVHIAPPAGNGIVIKFAPDVIKLYPSGFLYENGRKL